MDIVVQIDLDEDFVTGRRGTAPVDPELSRMMRRFAIDLVPQHPGSTDADLASFFVIEGVPPEQADQIAASLRELGAVRAAYVKPVPSMP